LKNYKGLIAKKKSFIKQKGYNMINENKAFGGVLSSVSSKAVEENVVMAFNIRHVAEGEVQAFLNSYESKTVASNIKALFNNPVQWKSINLEVDMGFTVEFDSIEFSATLKEIKIARAYKKGSEFFTYNLSFTKETDPDTDQIFQTYLNQKDEDEDGKKHLINYSVFLTPKAEFTSKDAE